MSLTPGQKADVLELIADARLLLEQGFPATGIETLQKAINLWREYER